MTPFTGVALMIAGPTSAPVNWGVMGMSGGAEIMPPRLRLAPTVTFAVWLICSEQSVPREGGMAAGTAGSQIAQSSSVTTLE